MNTSFKAVCKTNGDKWANKKPRTEIVVTKRFFGLVKSTELKATRDKVPGPCKDEIVIVTNVYTDKDGTFYTLAGYPFGGYDSRYFIRLDELQKEIAEKSTQILN